jgi:hypothetical protein
MGRTLFRVWKAVWKSQILLLAPRFMSGISQTPAGDSNDDWALFRPLDETISAGYGLYWSDSHARRAGNQHIAEMSSD